MPKFVPLFVLLLVSSSATGEEPLFKNQRAQNAEEAYQAALKQAREAYINELDVAIKEAGGVGDLMEANKMAEVKASLEQEGEFDDRDPLALVRKKLEGTTWKSNKHPTGFHKFLKNHKTINKEGVKGVWVVTDERTAVMQNYKSAAVDIFEFDESLKTAKVSRFLKSKDEPAIFTQK